MHWSYGSGLWSLTAVALLGAVVCGAEACGLVALGAWSQSGNRAEVVIGAIVSVMLLPFAITALRHARLTIDRDGIAFLAFGVLCCRHFVPWDQVRRYTSAMERASKVRRRMLLLELRDGSNRAINLSMYGAPKAALSAIESYLGPPAAGKAGITGVGFDD